MALRPSTLIAAVVSSSQKLALVLLSSVPPRNSLCQLEGALFGVCAHGNSCAWCQAPGEDLEPAPTCQCLEQDLPLPEMEEESS